MNRITAGGGTMHGVNRFSMVPRAEIPRSVFNRTHKHLTAFDAGLLVPIFRDEALPGDTMALSMSSLVRMATPLYPVMDNAYVDFFFFAVPIRLIWDNWQKFNGEQEDPGDSTDYLVPTGTETAAEKSLSDYFGIPISTTGDLEFCTFWHRAYNLIWNEWFRDQNLQDSLVVQKDDGPDVMSNYALRRRGKRHDYFASCLPFAQKGDAVTLPLGTTAPVMADPAGDGVPLWKREGGTVGTSLYMDGTTDTKWNTSVGSGYRAEWNDPQLVADLSTATAATINDIRQAFQIQRLLERDARGGSRYTEIIRAHFGVVSPDQRLQRPEYLGGGTTRLNSHPVPSTVQLQRYQGDLAAFVTAAADGVGFFKSFTEHCVVLGLVNIRADLTYQQGLHRMFNRRTRFDFYWPSLAHLGEQAVLSKEIFADGVAADDDVFGYQERYAEYRYAPSYVTADMRSAAATPLDPWHLALDFDSRPTLNDTFIEDDPPFDRVLATPVESNFFGEFFFNLRHARPMPTYSVPGLVDHF